MLGEKLKSLRETRGITQQLVADRLGMSRGTYAHYEINRREPDFDTLKELADFFKVSIDYLLEGNGQSSPSPEQKKPKDLGKFLEQSEVMFDGIPLTGDDKEKIKKSLEIIFWDAKQKNKRKKS